jgi:acetyltransferase-like isoleucine patch superfamily enzyme
MKKWIINQLALLQYHVDKLQVKRELGSLRCLSGVSIDESAIIGKNSKFEVSKGVKKISIKSGFSCRKFCNFLVCPGASLIVGEDIFFNNYCSINCISEIELGANTIFGEGVRIYDHDHKYEFNESLKIERNEFTIAPIKIGKNCWIGSNVTILKGVTIGDNVIIGANCLIYKSIPANSIVKHQESLIIEAK